MDVGSNCSNTWCGSCYSAPTNLIQSVCNEIVRPYLTDRLWSIYSRISRSLSHVTHWVNSSGQQSEPDRQIITLQTPSCTNPGCWTTGYLFRIRVSDLVALRCHGSRQYSDAYDSGWPRGIYPCLVQSNFPFPTMKHYPRFPSLWVMQAFLWLFSTLCDNFCL